MRERPVEKAPEQSHRRSKAPDLAFADTVVVDNLDDLHEEMPLSSDLRFNDESGIERRVASVAFPPAAHANAQFTGPLPPPQFEMPPARADAAPEPAPELAKGLRGAWSELALLWNATAALDADPDDPRSQRQAPVTVGRRVRTLLSFFEWDRDDVLPAAWIGLAEYYIPATNAAVLRRVGK
jgi:hypothetical protein